MRIQPAHEPTGVEPRASLDGGEQLERLVEPAEAPADGQLVDGVAHDQDVDERLAAREMRDDASGERDRRLETVRIARERVEHDADAGEVLLLVLADRGHARPRPGARVEIAHRVARAIRPHAEEVHRLALLRCERDATGLVALRDRQRETRHVRDPRDDVELGPSRRDAWPDREPERRDQRDGERVEMVQPARREAGLHRRRARAGAEDELVGRRRGPLAVVREERAADANALLGPRLVAAASHGEHDLLSDRHAPRREDVHRRPPEHERARGDERRDDDAREEREEHVRARAAHVDGDGAREQRDDEDRPPLVGERGEEAEEEDDDAARARRAEPLAVRLRRRDEDVIEPREVDLHVGTRTALVALASSSSAEVPPYRASVVSWTRCASTGPASAWMSSGLT